MNIIQNLRIPKDLFDLNINICYQSDQLITVIIIESLCRSLLLRKRKVLLPIILNSIRILPTEESGFLFEKIVS